MAGLSNIFGGDDSNSSADGAISTESVADATNTAGLDLSNSNEQSSTDEDGNTQSSSSEQDLGFDTNTDSLLSTATDAAGMSDESSN